MSAQPKFSSLKLVGLDTLVQAVAEGAHAQLQQLAARLPGQTDDEKKRALLLHLAATRQRLQRLAVLVRWCNKAPAVGGCKQLLDVAARHADALRDAADQLAYVRGELGDGAAPPYDVPTALHVLQRGGHHQLPSIIRDELHIKAPGGGGRQEALARMDFLLRCKLLGEPLPAGLRVLQVGGGTAELGSATGQYTARLTLVPSPADEVAVVKWTPPPADAAAGGAEGERAAAAAPEEAEVTQPGPEGGGGGGGAATGSDAAAAAAAPEAQRWRWRLLSFELLPRQRGPAALPAQLAPWLKRHVDDRMWVAADLQRLEALGLGRLIAVPLPPATSQQRQQRQQEMDAVRRTAGGGGDGVKSGATSSATAAAAAAAASSSHPDPRPSDGGGAAPAAAAPGVPEWARSPLGCMHSVLTQASSRLALSAVVVEEARALEAGGWAGALRVGRPPQGAGCRMTFWPQVPLLSYSELQALRAGEPAAAAAAAAAAGQPAPPAPPPPPAVDIFLADDGGLRCAASPPLIDPGTGRGLELSLFDPGGELSAERVLLAAAARAAALQLAGAQAALRRGGRLPAGWAAELVTPPEGDPSPGSNPPALQLLCEGEPALALALALRTGRPTLSLGPALEEDGEEAAAAFRALVQAAQARLEGALAEAAAQALPPGRTRATLAAAAVADALAAVALELGAERRIGALAARAAGAGLARGRLPRGALAALRAARRVDPASTLVLAAPAFPPPRDAPPDLPVGQRGSLRCFLLVDVAATAAGAGAPRLLLAVCSATPRGVVTGLRAVLPVPSEAVSGSSSAATPAPAGKPRGKRKRRSDGSDGGEDAAAAAAAEAGVDLERLEWGSLAAWARRAAAEQQLKAQLAAAGAEFEIELGLAPERPRCVLRLRSVPDALADLEREVRSEEGGAKGDGIGAAAPAAAALQLDDAAAGGAERGAWTARLPGSALAALPGAYAARGVAAGGLAGGGRFVVGADGGLELRGELARGDSAGAVLPDVARAARLHASLLRLLRLMQPAGGGRPPSRPGRGKQPQAAAAPPTFALESCGTVTVAEVTWTSATLRVAAPAAAPADEPLPAVALTLQCASSADGQKLSFTVQAQPELPSWLTAGLASHLEAGREAAFLELASLAAAPCAALHAAALAPAAQRGAGLLPGALTLERSGLSGPTGEAAAECAFSVRHLGRAARVAAECHRSGGVVLRVQALPEGDAEGKEWVAAAWAQVRALPGFCKCGGPEGWWASGWVPAPRLGAALRCLLHAAAQPRALP